MNYLTHPNGQAVSPNAPLPINNVGYPTIPTDTAKAVTLVAGPASQTGEVQLTGPILTSLGDGVGTHWANSPVYGSRTGTDKTIRTRAVNETAASASFAVYDSSLDLEDLLESVAAPARFVAQTVTENGETLYGYIGNVTKSGGLFTFLVFSDSDLTVRGWIGDLPGGTAHRDVTFYRNTSSITLDTATALTEEVPWTDTDELTTLKSMKDLKDGQYMVNYRSGRVLYRKADASTAETFSYKTYEAPASGGGGGGGGGGGDSEGIVGAAPPTSGTYVAGLIADPSALPIKTVGDMEAFRSDERGVLLTRETTVPPGGDSGLDIQGVTEDFIGSSDKALSVDISAALEASSVASATEARAYEMDGWVDASAATGDYYILIVNSSTVPSDGAVTVLSAIPVPHVTGSDTPFSKTWKGGLPASSGLVWVLSTTAFTKTIATGTILAAGELRYKAK